LAANAAFQSMFGYTDEELHGLPLDDITVEEDRDATRQMHDEIQQGTRQHYELEKRCQRKDGTPIWVNIYLSRMQGEESKSQHFLATMVDITDRKRAEAASRDSLSELARVARLTTMGEMTASIAHEISQPLGAIVTSGSAGLRWLTKATPDLEEARASFKRIVNEGHRAGQVILGIRAMLKKGSSAKEPLDVNELIGDVLMLAHGEIENQKIVIRTELEENLSQVLVDRIQLQQVVLNLVMNGIDAMSTLGDRARVLKLCSGQNGPSGVTLSVEDVGTGIDKSIVDRIFEAFFTTKAHGMGMGLSICRSIAVAHGGQLSVAPGQLHGSVFQLDLPTHQPGAA
jgi:PAS domain S-box-containing protein